LSPLKLQLKSILKLFDPKSRIFYIDYPIYGNIGDLLINIGTEQFFRDYNIPIYKRYSIFNMPNIDTLKNNEDVTFLCHGGGNFGDLYFQHQNLRERLIENFPRARIILLPQSLYYSSNETQRTSLKKIANHPNCHILARDQESFEILRDANMPQFSMMPDMAHQLFGNLKPTVIKKNDRDIYFLRQDKEATPIPKELVEKFASGSIDWNNIISIHHKAFVGSTYYFLKAGSRFLPSNISASMWYSARNMMIRDAVDYFSSHDSVYTNRLHAMILALLLGHDVYAFDNSYGKLSHYINSWLSEAIQD
jgi:exopolysaccharide biosynthesis predicted pyruvyltransferase EpsI